MILAFFFVVLAVLFLMIYSYRIGYHTKSVEHKSNSEKREGEPCPSMFFAGIIFLIMACGRFFLVGCGAAFPGDEGMNSLEENGVYEVVVATSTPDCVRVVILRRQDGGLIARKFMDVPPKVFKRMSNTIIKDGQSVKNPVKYAPFP